VHDDLTLLAPRLAGALGTYRASASPTVADLAHPVEVVDAGLPVSRLELVFRSPHVASVAVRDAADDSRVGLVTRARFTSEMTGRLGFGRAVFARRATADLTDWNPMVVAPTAAVSEVAVRAMQRFDDRTYDDVLIADDIWRVVSTADLVRSLSTLLAVRSLHDALTGLPHRSMLLHELGRRCAATLGTGSRVVVVLLDVRGFARLNAAHGHQFGDVLLTAIGARLRAGAPPECYVARTAGDEFAAVATMPAAASDEHADRVADGLRRGLLTLLSEPSGGIATPAWPTLHSAVVCSPAGAAHADELFRSAQGRLRAVKQVAATRLPAPPGGSQPLLDEGGRFEIAGRLTGQAPPANPS
jgi:diguanylate cyclase